MSKRETEFERIHRLGMLAIQASYMRAVSAQVRGQKSGKYWDEYRDILSQVLTLSALHGQSVAFNQAKKGGMKWDHGSIPKEKPDEFAAATAGFEVGDFWDAIWGFKDKIPNSWEAIQKARKEMRKLAQRIAKAESQNALDDITKRMETLQQIIDGSFVVKGATKAQVRKLKNLIADAIQHRRFPEGLRRGGMAKFISRAQVEGIVGMTSARLETVYRTNVASAYNNATAKILEKPAVQSWTPLVRLVEIHDRRTRGAPNGVYAGANTKNAGYHWQMDGYVNTAEQLRRQGLIPPNGYNCRGALIPLTFDESESLGLLNSDGSVSMKRVRAYNGVKETIISKNLYPDAGFKR